ncbi:MAG: hypothetical protein V3U72_02015 [Candidatus Aenigmarchaeota archaeon]
MEKVNKDYGKTNKTYEWAKVVYGSRFPEYIEFFSEKSDVSKLSNQLLWTHSKLKKIPLDEYQKKEIKGLLINLRKVSGKELGTSNLFYRKVRLVLADF